MRAKMKVDLFGVQGNSRGEMLLASVSIPPLVDVNKPKIFAEKVANAFSNAFSAMPLVEEAVTVTTALVTTVERIELEDRK